MLKFSSTSSLCNQMDHSFTVFHQTLIFRLDSIVILRENRVVTSNLIFFKPGLLVDELERSFGLPQPVSDVNFLGGHS
jgi:hypothetical protein